jgi:aminomethyltransferase
VKGSANDSAGGPASPTPRPAVRRTVLHGRHLALGARMVEFGGWEMPLQYPGGIIEEHLRTRREAGLFDVSHMGRFFVEGGGSLQFLQALLSNNAAALAPGRAQYTMIPNEEGGAVDDAYLYCLEEGRYLLVVNAANRERDWGHLQRRLGEFPVVKLLDRTEELAMLSLQGPLSRALLLELLEERDLPEPGRNTLCSVTLLGAEAVLARTGYTGEALSFEVFLPREHAGALWDALLQKGAAPVGLGARDTLRLEAGLPLYGHELGADPRGRQIPIFACPLARFAVSLSPLKGEFVGRAALQRQSAARRRLLEGKGGEEDLAVLPRMIRQLTLLEPGVARQGSALYHGGRQVGWVTSGTVAPYWVFAGEGLYSCPTDRREKRAVALALLDSELAVPEQLAVEAQIRERRSAALVVPYLLRAEAPPYSRPILYGPGGREGAQAAAPAAAAATGPAADIPAAVQLLMREAVENTRWRQERCINLIPSEMTQSPQVRLLSVMDPAFRYGEHRRVKALRDAEVFYYQGTEFIHRVEQRLEAELRAYLGCREVETRVISGQMANMAVFGALLDTLNREAPKEERRRLRSVLNHHILKGGHLSAQPMGALREFVAHDPSTEAPAVNSFPVLPEDPYRVDLRRLPELLDRAQPELIILGKSMVIYREPLAEVRRLVEELCPDALLLYDMAHVLGVVGPHFQEPFREGADVVTGSTHKTFFGTQRGVVGCDYAGEHRRYPFWEALRRRTFPGCVSNHHLGTLLGLLLAAYEMNAFKERYQPAVLANAKAFARALHSEGFQVAGDPALGHTETHQVIVEVGYCQGIEAARRLQESQIIVNFQASPREEGFTAAGALRLGVAEMTRFGMGERQFQALAALMREVVREGRNVKEEVARLRRGFRELRYCFTGAEYEPLLRELHSLI